MAREDLRRERDGLALELLRHQTSVDTLRTVAGDLVDKVGHVLDVGIPAARREMGGADLDALLTRVLNVVRGLGAEQRIRFAIDHLDAMLDDS